MMLLNKNLDLRGRVLLLRAGRNSFAEKVRAGPSPEPSFPAAASCSCWFPPPQVANAARLNASAVLIYPDPQDYPIGDTVELFGHVSEPRLCRIESVSHSCLTSSPSSLLGGQIKS